MGSDKSMAGKTRGRDAVVFVAVALGVIVLAIGRGGGSGDCIVGCHGHRHPQVKPLQEYSVRPTRLPTI